MKNKILVVDHEPHTFKILDLVLDGQDFEVIGCQSGQQALRLCASVQPDLVLLDLSVPDIPGRDIIKAIREWSQMPIILLSTRMTNADVISGLDMGADDYVLKPFNVDVLRARINASLRKSVVQDIGVPELTNGPLRIDLVRHQVFVHDKLVAFTPKEYSLLRYFLTHCGKMLSHRDLLREVWGSAHNDDTQYLRVFVGQIREKIEPNPTSPTIITTELGIGYRMEFLPEYKFQAQGITSAEPA